MYWAIKRRKKVSLITIINANTTTTYVFIYYTEMDIEGSDVCPKPNYCVPTYSLGQSPI